MKGGGCPICRCTWAPGESEMHLGICESVKELKARVEKLESAAGAPVATDEVAALREDLKAALVALLWCSGASDFQDRGSAADGFEAVVRPVLRRIQARLSRVGNGDAAP